MNAQANFRDAVIARIRNQGHHGLQNLSHLDMFTLFDIVMNEHEGFDGEEVSVDHMVSLMVNRYRSHKLAPSTN